MENLLRCGVQRLLEEFWETIGKYQFARDIRFPDDARNSKTMSDMTKIYGVKKLILHLDLKEFLIQNFIILFIFMILINYSIKLSLLSNQLPSHAIFINLCLLIIPLRTKLSTSVRNNLSLKIPANQLTSKTSLWFCYELHRNIQTLLRMPLLIRGEVRFHVHCYNLLPCCCYVYNCSHSNRVIKWIGIEIDSPHRSQEYSWKGSANNKP